MYKVIEWWVKLPNLAISLYMCTYFSHYQASVKTIFYSAHLWFELFHEKDLENLGINHSDFKQHFIGIKPDIGNNAHIYSWYTRTSRCAIAFINHYVWPKVTAQYSHGPNIPGEYTTNVYSKWTSRDTIGMTTMPIVIALDGWRNKAGWSSSLLCSNWV